MNLKFTFLTILLLSTTINADTNSPKIICCLGPSCSGKSTLAKQLSTTLTTTQQSWIHLDIDDLVKQEALQQKISEQKVDEYSLLLLSKHTNKLLNEHKNIVIDTNTWTDNTPHNFIAQSMRVLVYTPPHILLERDQHRTIKLKRPPKRAYYARQFVKHSFNNFFTDTNQNKKPAIDVVNKKTITAQHRYDLLVTTSASTTQYNVNQIIAAMNKLKKSNNQSQKIKGFV